MNDREMWALLDGVTKSQNAYLIKIHDKNRVRFEQRKVEKEESASSDTLKSLIEALYSAAFGDYDPAPLPCFIVENKEEATDLQKAALKKLQDKNKVRLEQRKSEKKEEAAKPTCAACAHIDGCSTDESFPCCSEFTEKQIPTCADCTSQNEDLTLVTGSGITLCSSQQTHVPLTSPACGWFVQASKGENEPEQSETLQEKTRTLAETISDLYYQIASLDSQKESLKSANKELLELSNNCPDCEAHLQKIDALNDENEKLCDTFLEQDFKLRKELFAEKSRRIGMNGKLESRDSLIDDLRNCNDRSAEVITNLRKKVYEQSKEIEAHCKIADKESEVIANLQRRLQASERERDSWKSSLSDAEFALGAREVTIDVLTKKNDMLNRACSNGDEITNDLCDQLHRAEEEYMKLADAQSGTATAYTTTRDTYRAKVKGN